MSKILFRQDLQNHTKINPIKFNDDWYYSASDFKEIMLFALNKYRVLGFEGYTIQDKYIVPNLNCIGDFSDFQPSKAAIQDIYSKIDFSKVDLIEIVVDDSKPYV